MKKPLLFGMLLTVCIVIITFVFAQFYPEGMISYWKFDEGSGTTAFDSADANDGTIYGATWTTGIVGNALSFDGVDDYVDAGNDTSLQISNDITVSLWVKIPQSPLPQYFISKYDGVGDSGWLVGINSKYNTNGEVRFCGRDGSGWCTSNFGPKIDDNQWHHIVGQREGSVWKIFVDGCLSSQNDVGTSGSIAATSINLNLGRDTSLPAYYTEGLIDEVAIYNRALSAEEIAALAGLTCVAPPDNLVSWWPGDGDADDIVDGNDGTLVNEATFADGKVGQAFSLDGVNDYVKVDDSSGSGLDGMSNITIDAWIYPTDVSGFRAVIAKYNTFSTWEFSYYVDLRPHEDHTEVQVIFYDVSEDGDSNRVGGVTESADIQPNRWYHIAGTWDDSSFHIYVNGVDQPYVDRSNGTFTSVWDNGLPVHIGVVNTSTTHGLARFFKGLIDEVEIFNRALSQLEIQDIYTAGCMGKCKFIPVDIDIKPGSYPNSINLGSGGNVPVAIFSTADFDATTVVPITVTLAGASVKLKGKGTPMSSFEDVNNDGILDIVVHVDTSALQLSSGDTEAILEGETSDGVKIRGVDTVRIVKE